MTNTKTFIDNPYESDINPDKLLKGSFSKLGSGNIPDIYIASDEVKREYTKYHYLILNKLYYDKNNLEYTQGVLNNSTKNAITHSRDHVLSLLSPIRKEKMENSLSVFGKKQINEKLISYPLYFMWEYVNANLDDLKTGNDKQIEFVEKFGLSHLQDVKSIVEILGFNDVLNWTTINLPVEAFKGLILELKSVEESGVIGSINGNSLLLSFAISLKVENFENLYYGAVALGYKEKMGVQNVKMPTFRMNKILHYVKDKYGKPNSDIAGPNVLNFMITEEGIQRIYEENLHLFVKDKEEEFKASKIAQIKSNIRSALRGFGYRLEKDIYKINNNNK